MARAKFSAGFEKPAQLHCAMPKNLSQKHIASFVYPGFPIRPLYQQILIGKASFQIDEAISDSLWLVKQGMLPPVLPKRKDTKSKILESLQQEGYAAVCGPRLLQYELEET
jgi:hypothetical protein